MLLLEEVSFPVINNLDTPSSEIQINFGVLQFDAENSATGTMTIRGLQQIKKKHDGKTFNNNNKKKVYGLSLGGSCIFA